jgi:methyl-accepting chemotaxis protein
MATAIAAAVEQQSAATAEISRNVQQAAGGSGEVSQSVSMIASASEKTGKAAGQVFDSARQLSGEAKGLDGKVRDFLVKIHAT